VTFWNSPLPVLDAVVDQQRDLLFRTSGRCERQAASHAVRSRRDGRLGTLVARNLMLCATPAHMPARASQRSDGRPCLRSTARPRGANARHVIERFTPTDSEPLMRMPLSPTATTSSRSPMSSRQPPCSRRAASNPPPLRQHALLDIGGV